MVIPQPEHVIAFLFAEMGTTGSVDGAGRLVIKGRFQQKQIENVLRRYMGEHIKLFPPLRANTDMPYDLLSRICNLQDMQISRYLAHERKPYLFHGMRVLWE